MELKKRIYLIIGRAFPEGYKRALSKLISYSGERISVEPYIGSWTVLAIMCFFVASLIPFGLTGEFDLKYLILGIVVFFLVEVMSYLLIYFKVEERTRRVEEVLPDALQLIAANVRAGMTPFQALRKAARKEFGPLEEEIKHATSRAMGTESFSEVLLGMSKRIRSEILERAIELFTTAMHSGGHLAKLLEELAKDVEESRSLKKDLVTSTKTYVSFIMFTIIIGAPLLLAISIQFIDVITGMQAKAGLGNVGFGLSFLTGEIAITSDFLIKLAVVMLVVTSLLASMLLGAIQEGKPQYGLKYAPIIITGTLIALFVFRYFIGGFFGGMM